MMYERDDMTVTEATGMDSEIMGGELHMWLKGESESVLIGEYVELKEWL
jgi:hypothetical protein